MILTRPKQPLPGTNHRLLRFGDLDLELEREREREDVELERERLLKLEMRVKFDGSTCVLRST